MNVSQNKIMASILQMGDFTKPWKEWKEETKQMREKRIPYVPDVNAEGYIDWEIEEYLRLTGPGGKRIGTLCFLYGNGKWARGVAICDPHDQFSETIGSDVSYEYAIWAMAKQDSGRFIHNPVARYQLRSIRRSREAKVLIRHGQEDIQHINVAGSDIFDGTVTHFDLHSYYRPVLSEEEFKLYRIEDPILTKIRES